MSTTTTRATTVRTKAAVGATLLALAVGGTAYAIGGSDDDGAGDPQGLADGTYTAALQLGADGQIKLDVVELLTGKEAVDAAHEDGELDPSEDSLPNDVYLRNLEATWVPVGVDDAATVELLDCTAECKLAPVTLGDFLDGTVEPYGGDHTIVEVEIADGEAVSFSEIYLP